MSWGPTPSMAHRVRSSAYLTSSSVQIRHASAVPLIGSPPSPSRVFLLPETVLLPRSSAAPRAPHYAAGMLPIARFPAPSCWETGCGFAAPAQFPALESGEGSYLLVNDHQM